MAVRASCSSWSNSGKLPPFPGGQQETEGEARGGFRGGDGHGAELSKRSNGAEALVHLLVKKQGAVNHAARFCKQETLIAKMQALHEGGDKSGEVDSGILKQFTRGGIALIGGEDNHGENSGKHFIGNALGKGLHLVPGRDFKFQENQLANGRIDARAIEFVNGGDGGAAANIKGAAFIAKKRAVPTNASDLAMGIASDGGRSGAGDENDGGTFARGFESEFEIGANNHGFAGEFLLENAFHFSLGVRVARACQSRADSADIRGRDIHGIERGTRGFTNGSERAAKSDTHGIGRAAAAARENAGGFVHEDAFRLGAATIEAENIAHSQSIREEGRGCTRARGGVLKGLGVRMELTELDFGNIGE